MSDASSKQPGNTWHRRRSRPAAFAAFVALLLGLFCCGMPNAAAAATPSVRISLDTNLPAVSASGTAVQISGTLTNTGSGDISAPVVHVAVGDRLLDTRTSANAWIAGKLDWPLHEVASAGATTLTPGSVTPFTVTIPGDKLNYVYALASLPLQITVTEGAHGPAAKGAARSSIHLQNGAVVSPLQVSVVIPLTVPADPDLFGPSGSTRATAWEHAIGPDSLVQRTLDAFAGQPVTFAVDPELLDPPAAADDNVPTPAPVTPSSSASPDSSPSGTDSAPQTSAPASTDAAVPPTGTSQAAGGTGSATGSDTPESGSGGTSSPSSTPAPTTPAGREKAAVDNLTDRLSSLTSGQSIWWLPADDPDLTALATKGKAGAALLRRDFTRPLPDAARTLGDTRAVWPVGDLSGAAVTAAGKQLATGDSTTVAVLPSRAISPDAASSATHRTSGSAVLTYDESMSRIFSAATTSPGVQSGRLLTALLAVYQQSPGTPRSLALVAPRTGGANPIQLAQQLTALQAAHWVHLRSAAQTVTALRKAPATKLLGKPGKGTAFPPVTAKALSAGELDGLATSRARLLALESVMVGGDEVLPARMSALDIVGSTRWRGAPAKLEAVADRDDAAIAAMLGKLTIRSSTINFFADSGDISVTVSNGLNRPVRGLQLQLQPRKYQIKVTDGLEKVDVEAGSRSTTHFHIKAVGGGTVPIDAILSAPNGTSLSVADAPPQLKINVHPTSGWIMWVLGGLAGLILIFGLLRAARRGPRTASGPTPPGEPTPDEAIVDAGQPATRPTDSESDD